MSASEMTHSVNPISQEGGALNHRQPPLLQSPTVALVVRWAALALIGALMVVTLRREVAVSGSFLSDASTLLWPEVALIALTVAAVGLVLATRPGASSRARWVELGLILALGLIFRAVVFPSAPTLSHDAYRYVWDAQLVAHGISPYTHALSDPALASLRDSAIWPNVNWRDSPTIYPPGAQLFYLLVALMQPLNIFALKAGIEVCDLLCCLLTLVLLRRRRVDLRRVIIYWWNPIAVIEFALNGHVDAVALLWTLAAVVVARQGWRGARTTAGVLLGLATLTKLYPLLFVIALVRRRDRGFLLGLGGTIALVYAPFLVLGTGGGGFLRTYIEQHYYDQGILANWVSAALLGLGVRSLVVALIEGALLALLCALVAWWRWRYGLRPEAAVLALSVVWILLSPHLFPWYMAALLPFLAPVLRLPSFSRAPAERSVHLAGAPALAVWLFVLAMPLTYVIFAPGYDPKLFQYFFYIPFAVAALPLLSRLRTQRMDWSLTNLFHREGSPSPSFSPQVKE